MLNNLLHRLSMPSCMVIVFFFHITPLFAQKQYLVKGTVTELGTGNPLAGVNIILVGKQEPIFTNNNGEYQINLETGLYRLRVAYVGFIPQELELKVTGQTLRDIMLKEDPQQLLEVQVTGTTKAADLKAPQMSLNRLSSNELAKIPAIFGEIDPLKAILQFPGVTNAGEGSSGFNVRGGSSDQNLILLDGAPVFSSSHLFGMFSVFNADIVGDLNLYKGGIPAIYGGRASSVLDINSKDILQTSPVFSGGLGLITSRLSMQAPFGKNRGGMLIAARSSYAHLFLKISGNENTAYFYDLNAKLDYRIGEKDRLFISGYLGNDVLGISNNFVNNYGNAFVNAVWKHRFSEHSSGTFTAVYSGYDFRLKINPVGLDWTAGINSTNLQYDISQTLSQSLKIGYGLNLISYQIKPGEIVPFGNRSPVVALKLIDKNSFESSAYFQAEQTINAVFRISYGLRLSSFLRMGGRNLNLYDSGPVFYDEQLGIYTSAQPSATQSFKKSEIVDGFFYPEPRIAASFQLNEQQSLKLSYNRMVQYLHLISNSNSPTPVDVWAPSDRYFKPQIADQLGVGYFLNLAKNKYSLELEAYFKKIQNRLDYIDGANLVGNDFLEQVIMSGKSRAYGLELLFRKNYGKVTGWLSYTLSKTEQLTTGTNVSGPGINNGKWYLTNYDKPHNFSLTTFYPLSKKLSFGATFTYQTGRPTSYPVGKFNYLGIQVPVYGARNAYRLPDFHHLDLSVSYVPNPGSGKKIRGEWVLSFYNLYNRKNTSSINFSQNSDTYQSESVRLSLFGIVPAVTYNFKFK